MKAKGLCFHVFRKLMKSSIVHKWLREKPLSFLTSLSLNGQSFTSRLFINAWLTKSADTDGSVRITAAKRLAANESSIHETKWVKWNEKRLLPQPQMLGQQKLNVNKKGREEERKCPTSKFLKELIEVRSLEILYQNFLLMSPCWIW